MTKDELQIRGLIERWAISRDAGLWDRLGRLWHPGGTMKATWFDGPAKAFVAASRAAWARGVNVTHFLGGSDVDVEGARAVAQTRMTITQRTLCDGQEVDVICVGRFYDLLSRREGRWGLDRRQLIYENDRIVPVVPGPPLALDADLLASFPPGYRHLGYVQTRAGMTVSRDLPGRQGPELEALLARGRAWLAGTPS